MTWERAALVMAGFILGVGGTVFSGLIFNWLQKRSLTREMKNAREVPPPRGRG